MQKERKSDLRRRLHSNMAVNVIGGVVLLLALFGFVSGVSGLASFTNAFRKEYDTTTYHMADTAAGLVNGDNLTAYLEGRETEEYLETKEALDLYCHRMNVSLVYVIQVDRSDYGSFVSIFNLVDNEVDDTSYVEWELGHRRDTTNDEYREKYRAVYEQKEPYATVYRIFTSDQELHSHITTFVPVKDSAGEVAGLLCVQRPVRELVDARRPYFVMSAMSTILLALIASAAAAVHLRRQVVDPIQKVAAEATRFARTNTLDRALGDISRYEELASLAASIDTMERDMVNYMDNLTQITAERERVSTELALSTRIQASMLPSTFPAFPDRPEFDVYATMEPAREVGGDFYDFFLIDEDHLGMVMADVSGKGVPAALFMMAARILLKHSAMIGKTPAQILTDTNTAICDSNQEEMFVTVWLGILEISTGRLTAANAGHEYPALKHGGDGYALYKDKHGFVLGGMAGMGYREYELQLEPGDRLFLYTDGVPEAMDGENRLFGTERMLAALNREPEAHPEQVLKNVHSAVDDFVKDAEQFDDLTMLCLEYSGSKDVKLSDT